MNRAERRKMMRQIPRYKKIVKDASKQMTNDLEKMFQKQWSADGDETLNDGDIEYWDDNGEDEIYND